MFCASSFVEKLLEKVKNADISLSYVKEPEIGYRVGEGVQLSCHRGYKFSDDTIHKNVSCVDIGVWDPIEDCQGMRYFTIQLLYLSTVLSRKSTTVREHSASNLLDVVV